VPGTSLRLLFAGTPDFAALYLNALIESEHQLIGVYSQPDRPSGRGKKLQPGPVKKLALEAGLPLFQPASLKDTGAQQQLAGLQPDAMIVVAYGLILPQAVLDIPRFGCLNVHASLLPRWRGAAPIQRAIEAGDAETGITIMRMDAGLDTGDMLATARCPIGPETTAAVLHDQLADLGAPLLLEVLEDLPGHLEQARRQDDAQACYAPKIAKSEAQIDWSRDAAELDRQIRAFNPFPGCFTKLAGERLKVWRAQPIQGPTGPSAPGTILKADRDGILVSCGRGQLRIQRLQLPGGKPLTAEQVLNAGRAALAAGQQFEPEGSDGA
jgi:methionyl-tRNA formyltransferase